MTTQAIDPATSLAVSLTPALAATGSNSPIWMVLMAAAAGALVWTVSQKPTEFWPAMSMMLTGTFVGAVGSKWLMYWSKDVETFRFISKLDQEYVAAALGLLGNLLFSLAMTFIQARAKKEADK